MANQKAARHFFSIVDGRWPSRIFSAFYKMAVDGCNSTKWLGFNGEWAAQRWRWSVPQEARGGLDDEVSCKLRRWLLLPASAGRLAGSDSILPSSTARTALRACSSSSEGGINEFCSRGIVVMPDGSIMAADGNTESKGVPWPSGRWWRRWGPHTDAVSPAPLRWVAQSQCLK